MRDAAGAVLHLNGFFVMAAKERNKPVRRRTPRATGSTRRIKPNRPQTVWMSLIAAMTVGAGLLYAVSQRPAAGSDGLAVMPLMATDEPNSVEVVLDTRVKLAKNSWKSVVIHDTGSAFGSQSSLDSEARSRQLRGIGYHFVIGNGNGMGDGELFVTDRWLNQVNGAHVAGDRGIEMNKQSIGICLVGAGDHQKFTTAQMKRLVALLDTLQNELNIPAERVYLHRDLAAVGSPGKLFPSVELKRQLARGN